MKTYFAWDSLHPDDHAVMADGDKAVVEVHLKGKESFQGWLRIARSVTRWRELAMQMSGEDDMNSHAYRKAHSGAEKHFENLAKLNKAERSQCAWLWDHHVVLEAWHHALPSPEAMRYNHPSTIWRKNPLKEYREKKPRASRDKAADVMKAAADRIEDVAQRVEVATAVNPGLDLSTPEMTEASGHTMVDYYGVRPVAALIRVMAALVGTSVQSYDLSDVHYGASAGDFVAHHVREYGDAAVARWADAVKAIVTPPDPALDPAFSGSLKAAPKKRSRRRQTQPPNERAWDEHP
jgi:hypothetical protein